MFLDSALAGISVLTSKLGGILHLYTALGTKFLSLRSRIMKAAAPDVVIEGTALKLPIADLDQELKETAISGTS